MLPPCRPSRAVPEPAVMRPADHEGTAKPVLKKPGSAALLAKRRAYVADDEGGRRRPGPSEATRPAVAALTPARAEEASLRSPMTERALRSSLAKPQEESASVARQTPGALVSGASAGGSRAPEPPAALAVIAALVQAPVPPPPQVLTLADHGSSAMPGRQPAHGGGSSGLISGWLQADSSVRVSWGQAEAVIPEGRKEAGEATVARDAALIDAASAKERCRMVEAELKALSDEKAARTRRLEEQEEELKAQENALVNGDTELEQAAQEQAAERSRLGKLKEETKMAQASHTKLVSKEKARLEAREKSLTAAKKVAAAGRDAFISLQPRSRMALQILYGEGYEEPLVTPEKGPARLLPVGENI
nr:actin cytoskeleton-regulatory complex protein PAN1-like [Aegilops tauschii subsp. strangulata]